MEKTTSFYALCRLCTTETNAETSVKASDESMAQKIFNLLCIKVRVYIASIFLSIVVVSVRTHIMAVSEYRILKGELVLLMFLYETFKGKTWSKLHFSLARALYFVMSQAREFVLSISLFPFACSVEGIVLPWNACAFCLLLSTQTEI